MLVLFEYVLNFMFKLCLGVFRLSFKHGDLDLKVFYLSLVLNFYIVSIADLFLLFGFNVLKIYLKGRDLNIKNADLVVQFLNFLLLVTFGGVDDAVKSLDLSFQP